jgi:hypothetical protein
MASDAFPPRLAALPFVVAIGLTVGAAIASSIVGPEQPRNNDVAIGGAIVVYGTFAVGFVVSLITIVIGALIRQYPPARVVLRGGLAVVAGGIIGALAWTRFTGVSVIALALLIGAPIGLSWTWPRDDFYA